MNTDEEGVGNRIDVGDDCCHWKVRNCLVRNSGLLCTAIAGKVQAVLVGKLIEDGRASRWAY